MDFRCSAHVTCRLGVALFVVLTALSSAYAQPAEPDAQTVAREAYAAGVAAFQRGDDEQARAHFVAANEAYSSPNVKLMLARALIRLERRIEAHAVLAAAATEARAGSGPRYEQTKSAASEELRQLEQQLAIVNLHVDDPSGRASLRVGSREIPREAWQEPVVTEPGSIEIALTGPEGQRDEKQLEMSGGTAATLAMTIPAHALPAPRVPTVAQTPVAKAPAVSSVSAAPARDLRPLGYAAAGVGAAGIVAFGVLGALSNAQFATLDKACPDRTMCSPSLREHATQGRTYQTLANVSLGVGITALAAGVALWVFSLPGESAHVSVTAQGAQLRGTF